MLRVTLYLNYLLFNITKYNYTHRQIDVLKEVGEMSERLEYGDHEAQEYLEDDRVDTSALKQYLREIGKYRLLEPKEVEDLFKRTRDGDKEAYNKLVVHNLRLVVKYAKIIKKTYKVEESIMDLIQAGNIGLMRAVDKYEYKKGYAFSTYATWWIRQSIVRHIYDNEGTIRVPVHMSEKFIAISKAIEAFKEQEGREPTFEELKEHVKLSEKDYKLYKTFDKNVASLNTTIGEDGDSELMDFISSDDSPDPVYEEAKNILLSDTVREVLEKLDKREGYIIQERFGLNGRTPKTLEEIGYDLGLTRERVRQIESVAMKKLRTSAKASSIRAFA